MHDVLRAVVLRVGATSAAAGFPAFVACAALGLWAVLYLMVRLATRPLPVRPGPPAQDLPGDEPPAVVAVLADDWSVTEDAAESTLLDLAARGYVELRQADADPWRTTVHVAAQDPRVAADAAARHARVLRLAGGVEAALTGYEQQVLDRVGAVAVGGVVPLTALTFTEAGEARAWSESFADAVLDDVRRRGLLQPRVPAWLRAVLRAAAALPGAAAFWFLLAADPTIEAGAAAFAGLVVFGGLWTAADTIRGVRGTAAGHAIGSRWLGLREYLQVDTAFTELPPAAVAVWDRYLAYGDALGVTRVCAAVIDLGPGDRRSIWSAYGGVWRRVRVRYPGNASRYGAPPGRLVRRGVYLLVLAVALMTGPAALAARVGRSLGRWGDVLAVLAVLAAARGSYRILRTAFDLAAARPLTGEVLRRAPWSGADASREYLVVDEGRGPRTTAWALPTVPHVECAAGDLVELRVHPWSRRVVDLQVRRSRRPPAPPAADPDGPAAPAGHAGPPVDGDRLSALLGLPAGAPMPMIPFSGAWLFPLTDGARGAVQLRVGEGTLDRLGLTLAARRGAAVAGVGDEAYLVPAGGVARQGRRIVTVVLPGRLGVPGDRVVAVLAEVLAAAS